MRQRRIKNLAERIENLTEYKIKEPELLRGKWNEFFESKGRGGKPIFLEIGSGKGQFIIELCKKNPNCNYIAVEVQPSVWVLAVEKAIAEEVDNVVFLNLHMKDITEIFAEGELDGIYLNFSDPWHKARHAKRRLTHRKFMKKYFEVLKNDGFVKVKTDNDNLFDFTLEEIYQMNEIDKVNLIGAEVTRDLHNSRYEKDNIRTEYEDKFSSRGKNINYIKIIREVKK